MWRSCETQTCGYRYHHAALCLCSSLRRSRRLCLSLSPCRQVGFVVALAPTLLLVIMVLGRKKRKLAPEALRAKYSGKVVWITGASSGTRPDSNQSHSDLKDAWCLARDRSRTRRILRRSRSESDHFRAAKGKTRGDSKGESRCVGAAGTSHLIHYDAH